MTPDPTFAWLAECLHCAPVEGELESVVKTVDWRCNALASDGLTATAYGTVALAPADPVVFQVFEELTEAGAVQAMKNALGEDEVARIEANLAGEINKRRNPPVVPMSPPWSS